MYTFHGLFNHAVVFIRGKAYLIGSYSVAYVKVMDFGQTLMNEILSGWGRGGGGCTNFLIIACG